MTEPKFPKGSRVTVNNRDFRGMPWYPRFEKLHGQTGTIMAFEFWSTYLLPGETAPTDVYNYTIDFSGQTVDDVPQVILQKPD